VSVVGRLHVRSGGTYVNRPDLVEALIPRKGEGGGEEPKGGKELAMMAGPQPPVLQNPSMSTGTAEHRRNAGAARAIGRTPPLLRRVRLVRGVVVLPQVGTDFFRE
jgi:hypothetical protein